MAIDRQTCLRLSLERHKKLGHEIDTMSVFIEDLTVDKSESLLSYYYEAQSSFTSATLQLDLLYDEDCVNILLNYNDPNNRN